MLGGGLEPPRLSAYAPQTYVSAISPPEQSGKPKFAAREPPRKGKNFACWRRGGVGFSQVPTEETNPWHMQ